MVVPLVVPEVVIPEVVPEVVLLVVLPLVEVPEVLPEVVTTGVGSSSPLQALTSASEEQSANPRVSESQLRFIVNSM